MKALAPTLPVIEVENEGLNALLGKQVTLTTGTYIYHGKLVWVLVLVWVWV